MLRSWLMVALAAVAGCDTRSPSAAAATQVDSPSRSFRDADDLGAAIDRGDLRFDVKGLHTTSSPALWSATATEFTHRAVLVVSGKPDLAKGAYQYFYRVKRLSGGDPQNPRDEAVVHSVFIRNGEATLEMSGGIRTEKESWEREVIEVIPVGLVPVLQLPETTVAER